MEQKKNRKQKFRKYHKWLGLLIGFPLLLLCVSGIVLNHRAFFSDINVSRGLLPEDFRFNNWNNGLLRGTCSQDSTHLLIYGKAGVWRTNLSSKEVEDFNDGFPNGVDHRAISRVLRTDDGILYAAAQFYLYKKEKNKPWEKVMVSRLNGSESGIPFDGTRLTDLTFKSDSIVLTSRSHIYVYEPQSGRAEEITLKTPADEQPRKSLFRIVWSLHSGEMFGPAGKLIVDSIAVVFVFLFVTGIVVWLWPKRIKRQNMKETANLSYTSKLKRQFRWNFLWHNKIGRVTIVLTIFVAVTGWFLRPPMLIIIASKNMKPFVTPENAWEDKLRALQFDEQMNDWLLYTSDGFYSMNSLSASPDRTDSQPPVGVMGINVLCREFPPATYSEEERWAQQVWIVGSFNGLYAWHRPSRQIMI